MLRSSWTKSSPRLHFRPSGGADGTSSPGGTSTAPGYDSRLCRRNLQDTWWIRDVEIPTQWSSRRWPGSASRPFAARAGATGPVSCAPRSSPAPDRAPERADARLSARRTHEHPLAFQFFGCKPAQRWRRTARMRRESRRGRRQHELRLPAARGDEDRRRCTSARSPRPRVQRSPRLWRTRSTSPSP